MAPPPRSCTALLTEGLQAGASFNGVRVLNPFA
jgi:predicted nucleic acid-binding protein